MAYRSRRRTSGGSMRPRRRSRRARWIVVVGGPLTVTPNTYVTVSLLSPIIPAATLADSLYQQMTKPTIIAIMGHMTLQANNTFATSGVTNALGAEYAWGIYRDVDISSAATDLPAYSAGYSNSWMVHKTGTLSQPAIGIFNAGGLTSQYGYAATDINYRRYELNLRRYKRTMDSANDTLILSVENNTILGSTFDTDFAFSFYFRMLLLE